MSRLIRALRSLPAHVGGATAIEYGLIAALLSVVVIGAVNMTGTKLFTLLSNVSARLVNG